MTRRLSWAVLAGLAVGLAALVPVRAERAALPPPAPPDDPTLPPLPVQSARNASYTIQARLDPQAHRLDGSLVLTWRNLTGLPQPTLPFHLYWNAYRNDLSTMAREGWDRRMKPASLDGGPQAFAWQHVLRVRVLGSPEKDITSTLRFVSPDDGNPHDRTVFEVTTPVPVPPEGELRLAIDWTAQVPNGRTNRAGWVHDYNFLVQWFPKIGVFWKGAWNAHQFHAWSEFFADFGVYDVALTVPRGFVVGATGRLAEKRENTDGTETHRYLQDDVHDFAWTASRRFREHTDSFQEPGYPPVAMRLLLQPEHEGQAARYLDAAKVALRAYGTWAAPYPYAQLTIVDPAWTSASEGMEYPTLITGGTYVFSPPSTQSPELVTIHETGHQFWYLLVASNEFEEPWLDEGFTRYHDRKAVRLAYGPRASFTRYFGLPGPDGGGIPIAAPGVFTGRADQLASLREQGPKDPLGRPSWAYLDRGSYGLNAYTRPALTLHTLEGLLGEEAMTRVLRTWARRYRFQHPTTADFLAVVNEVTGQDWRWFFDEVWGTSEVCDYAVSVKNLAVVPLRGFQDGPNGGPPAAVSPVPDAGEGPYEPEVTVRRLGGVRLPVEVEVGFADGRTVRERWDGRERWFRFRYPRGERVVKAVVDPGQKIALDVVPANNAWVQDRGAARAAARRWSARWMLWLQQLLELQLLLG